MDDFRPLQAPIVVNYNTEYSNAWTTYSQPSLGPKWQELGDLLAGREGWHCDVVNSVELMWSFGTFRGSLLNIQVLKNGQFGCFDYSEDENQSFELIADVDAWILKREPAARKSDLETSKDFLSANNWHGLRNFPFELDVDYVDPTYIGVIRGGAHEATFARSLKELIINAKQMIVAYFDSEESMGDQLIIRTHLAEAATKHFSQGD